MSNKIEEMKKRIALKKEAIISSTIKIPPTEKNILDKENRNNQYFDYDIHVYYQVSEKYTKFQDKISFKSFVLSLIAKEQNLQNPDRDRIKALHYAIEYRDLHMEIDAYYDEEIFSNNITSEAQAHSQTESNKETIDIKIEMIKLSSSKYQYDNDKLYFLRYYLHSGYSPATAKELAELRANKFQILRDEDIHADREKNQDENFWFPDLFPEGKSAKDIRCARLGRSVYAETLEKYGQEEEGTCNYNGFIEVVENRIKEELNKKTPDFVYISNLKHLKHFASNKLSA